MKMSKFDITIRHNVSSSVVADIERSEEGVRLVAVRPKDGPLPEVSHILNGVYPDLAGVRRAVVSALKTSKRDTLDMVSINQEAYQKWMTQTAAAVHEAAKLGISLRDVPDEAAQVLPGDRLLIFVDVPGWKRISITLAPNEWSWRK